MEQIISSHGIISFGEHYQTSLGEGKVIVYLYDEDETNETKVSSVPESEINAEIISYPQNYSVIIVEENEKNKIKVVPRGIFAS
ncbi:MAG: hypothetical protein M1514_04170 [Patescibacteria group bacterium]|nr:hypothetical protein [Patescibacteria group bacterium]